MKDFILKSVPWPRIDGGREKETMFRAADRGHGIESMPDDTVLATKGVQDKN